MFLNSVFAAENSSSVRSMWSSIVPPTSSSISTLMRFLRSGCILMSSQPALLAVERMVSSSASSSARACAREAAQAAQRDLDVAGAEFAFAVVVAVGALVPRP